MALMIAAPGGVRVWLAMGPTDLTGDAAFGLSPPKRSR